MFKTNRIITGHNEDGEATIIYTDKGKNVTEIKSWPGLFVTELWVTNEMPIINSGSEDQSLRPMRHDPTDNGTIFRLVEIPPESKTSFDPEGIFDELGSHNKPSEEDSAKHPTMHKTNSVDYLVVLTGKMTMVMEDDEIDICQGDCIVQRGTNHAWVNKYNEPCVIAAVLIDAVPTP